MADTPPFRPINPIPTLEKISETFQRLNYQLFIEGDYNLNLIGVRNSSRVGGRWDDLFMMVYKEGGKFKIDAYEATTDPGQTELTVPSFPEAKKNGTAIMAPGQYRGLWSSVGWDGNHFYHQGKARGLQQHGKVRLYRDNNRNETLDLDPATLIDYGPNAGINLHPFWGGKQDFDRVYSWSAGCQVVRCNGNSAKWAKIMNLIDKASAIWDTKFTYTLLTQEQLK